MRSAKAPQPTTDHEQGLQGADEQTGDANGHDFKNPPGGSHGKDLPGYNRPGEHNGLCGRVSIRPGRAVVNNLLKKVPIQRSRKKARDQLKGALVSGSFVRLQTYRYLIER